MDYQRIPDSVIEIKLRISMSDMKKVCNPTKEDLRKIRYLINKK